MLMCASRPDGESVQSLSPSNKQIVARVCCQLASFAEQKGSSGYEYRVLVTLMTTNCQPLMFFIRATEAI